MSHELITRLAEESVFRPRQSFFDLGQDHVPFDDLTGKSTHEARARRESVEREGVVGIVGSRGGGKSSLIAGVCRSLPDSHVALRVPVTGADDPTSVNVVAAVALSQALHELDMDDRQRGEIEKARADGRTVAQTPAGFRGGTLGGGPIPAEIHAELGSLRTDLETNPLAVDRLAGIDRLITILVSRGLRPVFVLEDTEAAIGGEDMAVAEGFLAGPIHALVHEVDAACLVAIQDVFQSTEAFRNLAGSMALIDIPVLEGPELAPALRTIIDRRLALNEIDGATSKEVLDEDALGLLVSFYGEEGGNMRNTLAALQSAAEYAAETGVPTIGAGQTRAALESWRARLLGQGQTTEEDPASSGG
jgi:hypothetical protein